MRNIIDDGFIAMLEARDLQVNTSMRGAFGGNRSSRLYGSSAEFADYRDYFPGDDLRYIDWNLFARFDKLYLKQFKDERRLHHHIYIDASASMDWGEPNKGEMALKIAAALSFLGVQAMDRLSLRVLHDNSCTNLCPPFAGREGFYNAANLLNGVKFYGDSNMGTAITSLENVGHDDGISVIISDFLTEDDWKSAVDYLLYHKREVKLIQVLSRDEVTPALSGKVFMLDSESIEEEDIKNYKTEITRSSVRAYEEALLWHQNNILEFCRARNVSFSSICSDDSIEHILFLKATEAGIIK